MTGLPLIRISPESAGWAPDSTRISVDLPAPLPPTRPTTSPGVQVDGDAVDGVDAAERDADVAHLDERAPPVDAAGAEAVRSASGRDGGGWSLGLRFDAHAAPPVSCATSDDRVEADGRDEDDAHDDVLDRGVDREQDHARLERLHDHGAQDGAGDGPDAAGERRAADHRRRDDVQLALGAEADGRRVQAGGRARRR